MTQKWKESNLHEADHSQKKKKVYLKQVDPKKKQKVQNGNMLKNNYKNKYLEISI